MDFPIGVKQNSRRTRPNTLRTVPKGKMQSASVQRVYFMRLRKRPYREIEFGILLPAHLISFKPNKQSVYHNINQQPFQSLTQARSYIPEIVDDEAHCRKIQIPDQRARCWQVEIPVQEAFCNQIFLPEKEIKSEIYIFKQLTADCFSWQKTLPEARCKKVAPDADAAHFIKNKTLQGDSRELHDPIFASEAEVLKIPFPDRRAACAQFTLREPEITRAFTIPMLILPEQKQIHKFIFGVSSLRFYSLQAHLPKYTLEQMIPAEPDQLYLICPGTLQPSHTYKIRKRQHTLSFDIESTFNFQYDHSDIKIDPDIERMLIGPSGPSAVDHLQDGELQAMRARRHEVDLLAEVKTHKVTFKGKAASAKRQRLIELFQDPPIICEKTDELWAFYLDLQNVSNIKSIFLNNIEVPVDDPISIELTSNHITLILQNDGKFSTKIGGDRSYYWFKLDEKLQRGLRAENPTTGNYLLVVPMDWKCDNPEAKCFNGLPQQDLGLDHWKGYRVRVNGRNAEFPKFRLFNGMTRMCRWQTTNIPE
ncbi:MAG: hypothetical protein DWQ05_05205 [Calditrichaeota bacterium]|nr:MAG: hypothetical protein DWQ05_05205 [Calditrichota bacterium]